MEVLVQKFGGTSVASYEKMKEVCKIIEAHKEKYKDTIKSKKINTIGKNAFKNINKKATVKVPKAQKKKYAKLLNKAKLSKKVKIK